MASLPRYRSKLVLVPAAGMFVIDVIRLIALFGRKGEEAAGMRQPPAGIEECRREHIS